MTNNSSNNNRRVVITGSGNISSLGNDWQAVKASLLSYENAIRMMPEWDQYPLLNTRLASPVEEFELPSSIRPRQKRSMGRVAQLAVTATHTALEDAGLLGDDILTSGQTGVSYGSATGSSDAALEFFGLLEQKSMSAINTTTYLRMMSHTAAVNIGVVFGTQGRMYTTSSACTAGSQGVGFAYEAIRAGQQTVMITGGAEELCPTQAAVFDTILAASLSNDTPKKTPRPFDAKRDGLVLGEGATTLILEEYEYAMNRGANILAEVVGFATNTDGGHMVRPRQETMEKVMQLSLQDAGLDKQDIGYVCAHATATDQGDISESHATFNVLGKKPISSLKSYTGHSLGACGAFELWASINSMNEGWFAPTLNLEEVEPECADHIYIRDQKLDLETDFIMSNNFAFGGINTSLIVKKHY